MINFSLENQDKPPYNDWKPKVNYGVRQYKNLVK